MSKLLLLADSNFVNNIGDYNGRKIKDLEVVLCQSRSVAMAELGAMDEGIVVISCLDMLAADIIGSTPTDAWRAIEVYYNQLLFKLIEKVDEADGKLAAGVVAPLFWTSLPADAKRSMNHTYKLMKLTPLRNIRLTNYLKDVHAGADGTHLTKRSAAHYIQHIHNLFEEIGAATGLGPVVFLEPVQQAQSGASTTDWAQEMSETQDADAVSSLGPPEEEAGAPTPTRTSSMLSASILSPSRQVTGLMPEIAGSNLDETQARLVRLAAFPDLSMPPPQFGRHQTQQQGRRVATTLENLEERVEALEDTAFHNNLMMAALKEEQDAEANKACLNRVTLSGVIIEGLLGMSEEDKVAAMRAKVMEIVDNLKDEGQTFELLFVRHLNKQKRGQTSAVIEARFADPKQAKALRSKFVEKHKQLGLKINITPVVRVATRVRVEMMHGIANLLQSRDSSVVKAMCVQFIPKPVIKVVRKSAGGLEITRTMSFTEAVCWIRQQGLKRSLDLVKARARAGASFRGTLAQHFVLMD